MGLVVASAMAVAACSPATPTPTPDASAMAADRWGPLAVIPPQNGSDGARTEGRLQVGDDCVLLESPTGESLLVWPADRTRWMPERRSIGFANTDGVIATVQDGSEVVLGGSGDGESEGGRTAEEWMLGIEWVVPPRGSCAFDRWWFVGDVRG
jgi:hypothetical protein